MRNAITKRLTAVFVAAAALSVSATASAQQHSYAVVTNPNVPAGDADVGGAVKINTHDLVGSCVQFVNHEFWYGVDAGKFSAAAANFVVNAAFSSVAEVEGPGHAQPLINMIVAMTGAC
jgi:hypothetical protein